MASAEETCSGFLRANPLYPADAANGTTSTCSRERWNAHWTPGLHQVVEASVVHGARSIEGPRRQECVELCCHTARCSARFNALSGRITCKCCAAISSLVLGSCSQHPTNSHNICIVISQRSSNGSDATLTRPLPSRRLTRSRVPRRARLLHRLLIQLGPVRLDKMPANTPSAELACPT
jgi:hypothetical protein